MKSNEPLHRMAEINECFWILRVPRWLWHSSVPDCLSKDATIPFWETSRVPYTWTAFSASMRERRENTATWPHIRPTKMRRYQGIAVETCANLSNRSTVQHQSVNRKRMKGYPSAGALKTAKKRKTSLTCFIFTVNFNYEVIKFGYLCDYCSKLFFRGPVGDLSCGTDCYAVLNVNGRFKAWPPRLFGQFSASSQLIVGIF